MEPSVRLQSSTAAISWVQCQSELSLPAFPQGCNAGVRCDRAISRTRRLHNFRCPTCGSRSRDRFCREGRLRYRLQPRRDQITLRGGTSLAHHKRPPRSSLLAMYLLRITTKTNLVALELMRRTGADYEAACHLVYSVTDVATTCGAMHRVEGSTRIDDASLGGAHNAGKVTRGAPEKQAMAASAQTVADTRRSRYTTPEPTRTLHAALLQDWRSPPLTPTPEVRSRGRASSARAICTARTHSTQATGSGPRASTGTRGSRSADVIAATAKRAISDRYYAFTHPKYARLYHGDSQYRFNRRLDSAAMIPHLLQATTFSAYCPEQMLCAAENFHSCGITDNQGRKSASPRRQALTPRRQSILGIARHP